MKRITWLSVLFVLLASFASSASATVHHTGTTKSQAVAACQSYTASAGGEVPPSYGCAVYMGAEAECQGAEIGGAYTHISGGYHVFCFVTDDTPNECADLKTDQDNPSSPNYNDPDNTMTRTGTSACLGGCTYAVQGPRTKWTIGGEVFSAGHWGFDGTSCSPTPESPAPAPEAPPPKPTEPACKAAPSGQTFCVTQDNKQCYTATTGKMICWSPGETGKKTEGPVAQTVQAGTSPAPAPTPPPPGDTFAAAGSPTTSTAQTINSSNTTTNTTTTTVQNYTTVNGTNAGTVNQGQGQGTEADGASDASGSASGMGDCNKPPTCSGSAVDCAIFVEAHNTACASKRPGEAMTTAEINGIDGGSPSENPANGTVAGVVGGTNDTEFNTGDINGNGFLAGSRSCPTVPPVDFYGTAIALPNDKVCLWLSIGSYLILAFAGLASLRIIAGGV